MRARPLVPALVFLVVGCRSPTDAAVRPAASVVVAADVVATRAAQDEVRALGALPGTREVHVVVMDPRDGALLAMAGGERRADAFVEVADLPLRRLHTPGSVMKPFTIAAALEAGVIAAAHRVSGSDGEWTTAGGTLHDASRHGEMSLGDVMAFSSNIGTAKIAGAVGAARLARAFERFGFGGGGGAAFPDAAKGRFEFGRSPFEDLILAGGESGRTTPFEVASAFCALVNGGERRPPSRSHDSQGGQRVLSEATVRALTPLLEGVVARDDGTGTKARVEGVRVLGKTGTAEEKDERGGTMTFGTFVGAFPVEAPRAVVLVAVATSDRSYSGGTIAAPSFRRIAERLLESGARHDQPRGAREEP